MQNPTYENVILKLRRSEKVLLSKTILKINMGDSRRLIWSKNILKYVIKNSIQVAHHSNNRQISVYNKFWRWNNKFKQKMAESKKLQTTILQGVIPWPVFAGGVDVDIDPSVVKHSIFSTNCFFSMFFYMSLCISVSHLTLSSVRPPLGPTSQAITWVS